VPVDSSEATLERERCSVHPDRGAVGVCERCGRTVCLECAVAFRGAVRCERCAALELGDPEPVVPVPRRRFFLRHAAFAALVVGLVSTVPPWHRSGTLTSILSAWNFTLDGWAGLGCAALAASVVILLIGRLRPSTGGTIATATLSGLSALSILVALARAPEFFSATAAPFVALAGSLIGAGVCAFSLVRRPRP
jgi:hypothetical protein